MDLKGFVQYIPKVDKTLTLDGECADAKVAGDKIRLLDEKTEWETLLTGCVSEYSFAIPECEEVFFEVINASNDACVLKVPHCAFKGKNRKYFIGGHITDTAYFGAHICINDNVACFKDPYLNGNYDSTATLSVYCKGVK